ncbi:vomeronasal type-2 receptor 26-like [Dendropsophus ebraccatus]|uniref:vomeronasal type-2 receptor 26-like n=1 Tax=Dendropsophus ebraccatus TaxID=150705 RepID=UPI0038317121
MGLIISFLTLSTTLALSPVCKLKLKPSFEDYEYYKHGDIIIGGIFSVYYHMDELNTETHEKVMRCAGLITLNYKYFLNFLFAIEEVNRNPYILPNVTLGYHVYDSCSNVNKAVKSTIQILSGPGATVPNYYCTGEDNIAGFIGDLLSVTSVPIAQLLNVYRYTQISYGATDPMLSDRVLYPYLFRTARSDHVYVSAVLSVLKHFSWNWVGIITSADDSGDKESQVVSSFFNSQSVCIEFTVKVFTGSESHVHKINTLNEKSKKIISCSFSRIIIVCGTFSYFMIQVLQLPDDVLNTKTFLLPPNWFTNTDILYRSFRAFNCSLGFLFLLNDDRVYNNNKKHLKDGYNRGNMKQFLLSIHPSNYPDDKWLENIWILHFKCLPTKDKNKGFYRFLMHGKLQNCSGKENVTEIPLLLIPDGSTVAYNALMSMAYALHALHIFLGKELFVNYMKKSTYRHKDCPDRCLKTPQTQFSSSPQDSSKPLPGLSAQYQDLADVFSEKEDDMLPPHQPYNCPIDLIPGATPPQGKVYPLSVSEIEAISAYIKENLQKGFIHKSKSPSCLISFVKLDLRGAYNLIRICDGEEWKTAFNTRDGHFKYLPFELCNALVVFQEFVNNIFHDLLYMLIMMFLDEILIYSPDFQTHMLNKYLKELEYMDQSEMIKYYDERGEFNSIFKIYNWKLIENKYANYIFVGSFTPWAPPDKQLFINSSRIFWKNNKIPKSQCSEYCSPGSRKLKNDKKPICCYDCIKCPDGEISNTTDSENCIKCLDTEWSSSNRDKCFPKLEDFLSFSDGLSIALSSIAVLFSTISILILGIFVLHKDSPIVKANNKTLSFILLFSLSLCFLCVFLFIGRPVDRTCKLRQIVIGIIFSISVSSVLAKTIMVYMAFRISRPGSRWKKLIGVKVSNSIVALASSIEVIISIIWLYFSPPYLEQDTHSYHRKVIIQCNEGSQVGFFAVLGYLFVLAAVSFTVAYLARTLPDRFNEAKYITFSMLVFCSVWIAMVPSYLSTKGKNMVAVEIFSILTSSAGLLGFIFFPKCYIIVIKPQLNTKMRIHMGQ